MGLTERFPDITRPGEPLGPLTHLRVGGPAEFLVEPRDAAELAEVVKFCSSESVPFRVLGNGCNLLVGDEGVKGAVLRLTAPAFAAVTSDNRTVTAGGSAPLSALITHAATNRLAGVETLVGIAGTVGGAVRCNSGDRQGEIGERVRRLEVLDETGAVHTRDRSEVRFSAGHAGMDDPVILSVEFELEPDDADAIVKRMKRAWIQRKGAMPLTYQRSVRAFKDPKGDEAARLIERAGQAGAKVGGAKVSDRNVNWVVAEPGAFARDVLGLLDLVAARVEDATGVKLEREVLVW